MQSFPRSGAVLAASCLLLAACGSEATRTGADHRIAQSGTPTAAAHFDPAAWQPPPDAAIPSDSLGSSIRRGLALVTHTADSLPAYAPGRLNCSNCHLSAGRNVDAAPFAGAYVRFPKYMERTGAVIGLADRVNYCFTRSLGGNRLPVESREMQDILAYIAWLSSGVPVGEGKKLAGAEGLHEMPVKLVGDRARGASIFGAKCAVCHQADGQGNPAIPPGVPPLWGAKSFSVGASMARQGKAASFIWHNMPYGTSKTLTPQQAYDVAAYVTSQSRLDSPGKNGDWPLGGAPADVPYDTKGHKAYLAPPLLARANTSQAIVPPPASVAHSRAQVTKR